MFIPRLIPHLLILILPSSSNTMVTSHVQCNNTGNFTHSWFNVSEVQYLGKSVYYCCWKHFLLQYTPKCACKCIYVFVPNIHYYCPLFNHTGICHKVLPQGNLSNGSYIVTHTCRQAGIRKTIFATFHFEHAKTNIKTNLHISTKEHNCHILLSSYSRITINNIINPAIIPSDTTQTDWTGWRGCTQHPPLIRHNKIQYN